MTETEKLERLAMVAGLYQGLSTFANDRRNTLVVHATRTIPPHWLKAACSSLISSWDTPQPPKAREIAREALRLAGFKSRSHEIAGRIVSAHNLHDELDTRIVNHLRWGIGQHTIGQLDRTRFTDIAHGDLDYVELETRLGGN